MGFLDYRFKLPLHIVEFILIVAVCAISTARLFLPGVTTRTRANTIALGFVSWHIPQAFLDAPKTDETDPQSRLSQSAKSINFLLYQLLTDHIQRLRRWRSLKAYTILNGLEIVFWAAVVFLLIQANISVCVGVGCTLSWVVVGISISLRYAMSSHHSILFVLSYTFALL